METKSRYSLLPLVSGEYNSNNMGSGAMINAIRCVDDGQIIITALGGGTFVWNAIKDKKIQVLSKEVIINSGYFIAYFDYEHTVLQDNSTPSIPVYWIDENNDYFVDESGNRFILI